MCKDPAFLFYPSDWQGGTLTMTLQEKGCYIELLMLQFQKGKFTLAHAKHVLRECFDLAWPVLREKFKTDGQFFWNERLEIEKEKRQKWTESRRNNGLKEKTPKKPPKKNNKHMQLHMEDENENENIIKNIDEKEKRVQGKKEKEEKILIFPFDSVDFSNAWLAWRNYRQSQHNFRYRSQESEQIALKFLSELARGDELTAIRIIQQSIGNSWKGFFALKQNGKQQSASYEEVAKSRFPGHYK
jgi:uncharacterized protein YdaU (DUF1376 family)